MIFEYLGGIKQGTNLLNFIVVCKLLIYQDWLLSVSLILIYLYSMYFSLYITNKIYDQGSIYLLDFILSSIIDTCRFCISIYSINIIQHSFLSIYFLTEFITSNLYLIFLIWTIYKKDTYNYSYPNTHQDI